MLGYTGVPDVINGSVGTTRQRFLIPKGPTVGFTLINTHPTNDLELDFEDDPNESVTVVANGGIFAGDIAIDRFGLVATGGATTFQAVATK